MRSRRGAEGEEGVEGEEGGEGEARGRERVSLQLGSPAPPSRATAEVEARGGAAPLLGGGTGELSSSKVTKQLELASILISPAGRGARLPSRPRYMPRPPLRSCAAAKSRRAVLASVSSDAALTSPRSTPRAEIWLRRSSVAGDMAHSLPQ